MDSGLENIWQKTIRDTAQALRADPSILSMALRLTCELKPYQELFYNYYWGKFEREAGSASTSANIFADFIEAGAPQRVKNQGKRRRSTS